MYLTLFQSIVLAIPTSTVFAVVLCMIIIWHIHGFLLYEPPNEIQRIYRRLVTILFKHEKVESSERGLQSCFLSPPRYRQTPYKSTSFRDAALLSIRSYSPKDSPLSVRYGKEVTVAANSLDEESPMAQLFVPDIL